MVTGGGELTISGIAHRSGKEKSITLSSAKLAHHLHKRARMGRVLPEKLKPPLAIYNGESR